MLINQSTISSRINDRTDCMKLPRSQILKNKHTYTTVLCFRIYIIFVILYTQTSNSRGPPYFDHILPSKMERITSPMTSHTRPQQQNSCEENGIFSCLTETVFPYGSKFLLVFGLSRKHVLRIFTR